MWGAVIGGVASLAGSALSSGAATAAAGQQVGMSQEALTMQAQALAAQTARLQPYGSVGNLANIALASGLGLGGTPGGNTNTSDWNNPIWANYIAGGGFQGLPGQVDNTADQNTRRNIYSQAAMGIDSNAPGYGSLTAPITQASIQADPVYSMGLQFGLNQGNQQIGNQALASGNYNSGATLKALTQFANDYGTTKAQAGVNDIQSNRAQQYGFLSGQQAVGLNAAAGQNLATGNYANAASNLQTGIGNAQAAGTVGAANAYSNLGTSLGNAYRTYQNGQFLNSLSGGGSGYGNPPMTDQTQNFDYMVG